MTATINTSGWNIYEPAEFLCVDAYTGHINIAGRIKPVFILELYNDEKQISIVKFFNCNKTKSGNYTINKNSDFANIYRCSTGDDPRPRYSKAKQLLTHLIGTVFICEFADAVDSKGSTYLRANKIRPSKPVGNDGWFLNGKLKNKRGLRGKRQHSSKSFHQKNIRQSGGNQQATTKKKVGNELEIDMLAKPNDSNTLGTNLSAYQHTTSLDSSVEPLQHNDYMSLEVLSDKERIYRYCKKDHENEDEYFDRVLSESLSNW